MGTRHLIVAIVDGKHKLAQYGQWDGYPSGVGIDVLKKLVNFTTDSSLMDKFIDNLRQTEFVPEDFEGTIREYPQMSRDVSAEIFDWIVNSTPGLKLVDSYEFGLDGTFCEWAYFVDFDTNTFEVYRGFNDNAPFVQEDRYRNHPRNNDAVRFVTSWSLDKLPTQSEFLNKLEPDEE